MKKSKLILILSTLFSIASIGYATTSTTTSGSSTLSGSSTVNVQNSSTLTGSNVNSSQQMVGPVSPAPTLGLVNGGIAGFAPTSGFNSGLSTNFNYEPQSGGCPSWGANLFSYNASYGFGQGFAILTSGDLLNISGQFGPNSISRNNSMSYGLQYTTSSNYQYGLNLNITRWFKQQDSGSPEFSLNYNYDLQPYFQKVFGQNCIYLTGDYETVVSPQPDTATNSTVGTFWQFNPQYSYLASSALTYSTQATVRVVTTQYYNLSNQTGNTQSDLLQIQPFNISYNLPQISGLNVGLSWNISWNNFTGPQISGTGYNTSWNVNPAISYNGTINSTVGYWVKDSVTFSNNLTPWRFVTGQTSAGTYNETQISNCITFGLNDTFNAFTLSNSSQPSNVQTDSNAGGYNSNTSMGINDETLIQSLVSML